MTDTPGADREALHDEIEQTRADLGETMEALAAKTNVNARAKHAAAGVKDTIEDSARVARDRVTDVVATTASGARTRAAAARESARDIDVPALVRIPLTGAAILVGAAVAVVAFLIGRRRS
jgi:hypothetical protein